MPATAWPDPAQLPLPPCRTGGRTQLSTKFIRAVFRTRTATGLAIWKGITARLDYLKDLGVDAIWLTPFYPSPQVDFGYDISDYRNIDPQYGTLADFDRLVAEAEKRHIRIVMDMVMNHTSDKHEWFIQSRSSR